MFKAGDEVMLMPDAEAIEGLNHSDTYIVSAAWTDEDGDDLLAFANYEPPHDADGAFSSCFRKVQKRTTETGMAIFKGILDGQPVRDFEVAQ
jgi:hypothetical protein